MQPSGDSGDSSSEEEDDSSAGSADAEELAYLRQVEKSIPSRPPTSSRQWRGGASSRASSTGQMSMRTAPTEFRSQSSRSVDLRPMSAAASARARGSRVYDENFDDSVNPWVLHPSARQFNHIPNRPNTSQQDAYRSPMSTSSSVTATQYNNSIVNERSGLLDGPSDQHVLLGPATKRAIESLQKEIETLNERINGLRKEMVDRDNKRVIPVKKSMSSSTPEDGWKWVIKVNIDCACECDCY